MPSEFIPGKRKIAQAGIRDFIRGDIWSFGLLLHALLNPDKDPFILETDEF